MADLPAERRRELGWMALDFKDAFWQIPLAPRERKYFVARVRGYYLIFMRAAQGSRNGPLAWAGVASLLMRVSQAIFAGAGTRRFGKLAADVRLQTYVDDPIVVAQGTEDARMRKFCALALLWRVLGFRVAFKKARLGRRVLWIGVTLILEDDAVVAEVTAEKMGQLRDLVSRILKNNVVAMKTLREFLGKAENIATFVLAWRPFLRDLWAAATAASSSPGAGAPAGCIWTRQVRAQVEWFDRCLRAGDGPLRRRFELDAYLRRRPPVHMGFDASPWGLGGWLSVGGAFVSWFACSVTAEDSDILDVEIGSPRAQQVLEGLSILIGFRLWRQYWTRSRAGFVVEGDNVASLSMLVRLRAESVALNFLAKELALDLSEASFLPEEVKHVPGVTNKLADVLSRRHQPPLEGWSVPVPLQGVEEAIPPPRDRGYYLTLAETEAARRR